MSLHVYWHASGIHREEYQQYWSKREDITWAHGSGQMGNRWTYWQNYVLSQEVKTFTTFKNVMAVYPEVKEAANYRAIGEYSNHFLSSPIIEVAEDGLSAKGLFYTPGYIAGFATVNGKVRCGSLSERYGADFIFEDGKWVYLNLRVCPDIGGDANGGGFGEPREMPQMPPPDQQGGDKKAPAPPQDPVSAPWDIPGPIYRNWSATQVPQYMPPMPLPYKTLSETFLYSDVKTLPNE